MAYTTIDNPELYFQTKTYTGNGSTNAITFDGDKNMQPDWVWLKNRSSAFHHRLFDSVRGATKNLSSNRTDAESTESGLTSFDSDGFTLGSDGGANNNTDNYVSWNWKAGTAFSNSAGTNGATLASTGSKNTTAGFSIVSYTGDESGTDSVFHGLSQTPEWIIAKPRDVADNWALFHGTFSNIQYLFLNTTAAVASASSVWNSLPSATVFNIGDNASVNDDGAMIAYCFNSVKGYSKFGKYEGNGSTNGPVIWTGFKPAFVMQKNVSATQGYQLQDNKREGYNGDNDLLQPNDSAAESGVNRVDFLSNGFKVITTDAGQNTSGSTYIYMAFAESPLVNSNGVPNNAR
jgi:hypothetical protein